MVTKLRQMLMVGLLMGTLVMMSVQGQVSSGYPNCEIEDPEWISDGYCDTLTNNEDCGYDGGDCCECDCADGNIFGCGFNGWNCIDPASACEGETAVVVEDDAASTVVETDDGNFLASDRSLPDDDSDDEGVPVGIIVGGVAGGVGVIGAIIVAVLCKTGRLKTRECRGASKPTTSAAAKGPASTEANYHVAGPAPGDAGQATYADVEPVVADVGAPPAYGSQVGGMSPTVMQYPVAEAVNVDTAPPPAFSPTPPPAYQG